MIDLLFVSSNTHKAKYLKLWLDLPVLHRAYDLPEIQSLDLKEVVTHKVHEAHMQFKQAVLVEDVALSFHALGRLPGTLVKWFVEEIGPEKMCRLLDDYPDRSATAEIIYALHDGTKIHYFSGQKKGTIALHPRGEFGFGWNSIFIPDGQTKTYGEQDDDLLKLDSPRAQAIVKLRNFLNQTS